MLGPGRRCGRRGAARAYLIGKVRQARAQAAEARERERQRLHRELHDGSAYLDRGGDVHRRRDEPDRDQPGPAREILRSARGDVATALDDVRRWSTAYVRSPWTRRAWSRWPNCAVTARRRSLCKADALPPLGPAIELAAYRIAAEGIATARRHAADGRVRVRLTPADGLAGVLVDDNGQASVATVRAPDYVS